MSEDLRLQSLLAVAAAVAGAHAMEDVLEIAAEETCTMLDSSSLSISRWEVEQGCLRTLINVGELGESEERRPADETYALADFPLAHAVLSRGEPHISTVDDPATEPAERRLMEELGKRSCAAVPIVYRGTTWGEMYAANGHDRPRLSAADVQFMQAICSQLALAVGRAELYSQVYAAAYRDPLTGLANRRAFDERLEAACSGPVALLLGDVDGLKALNDGAGHEAGDDALRAVGRALTRCAGSGALAARIGGDEFALLLEGWTREAAEKLAAALAAEEVPVSWGVAFQAHGSPAELLRAADAACYATKRRRRGSDALLREAAALLQTAEPERLRAAIALLRT
jgi:diguanylate cyclase (GGDEF)-like protein